MQAGATGLPTAQASADSEMLFRLLCFERVLLLLTVVLLCIAVRITRKVLYRCCGIGLLILWQSRVPTVHIRRLI